VQIDRLFCFSCFFLKKTLVALILLTAIKFGLSIFLAAARSCFENLHKGLQKSIQIPHGINKKKKIAKILHFSAALC